MQQVWIALVVALVVSIAAIGTLGVISQLRHPLNACDNQLPLAEGLKSVKANVEWPPPLVRCVIADSDLGQESYRGEIATLTSAHLAVVTAFDLVALIGLSLAVAIGIQLRRASTERRAKALAQLS